MQPQSEHLRALTLQDGRIDGTQDSESLETTGNVECKDC